MLNFKALESIKEYLEGNFKEDFEYSAESRRFEMLEFLDQLMDLGELADKTATEVIFKGQLANLAGIKVEDKKEE